VGGEQASIEGFFEREVGELGRGEWKQVVADGSAAEEVTAAAKGNRTRPRVNRQ
jgi:hypothetical protein